MKSREDKFLSDREEMLWCAFKQTGNPYAWQEMTRERNYSKEESLGLER